MQVCNHAGLGCCCFGACHTLLRPPGYASNSFWCTDSICTAGTAAGGRLLGHWTSQSCSRGSAQGQQPQALVHSSMQAALSNGCLAAHTAAPLQTRMPASRQAGMQAPLAAVDNSHRRLDHLLVPQQIISAPHTVAPYHLHTTPHQRVVLQQQQQQQHTTHGLLLLASSGNQAACSLVTSPRPMYGHQTNQSRLPQPRPVHLPWVPAQRTA